MVGCRGMRRLAYAGRLWLAARREAVRAGGRLAAPPGHGGGPALAGGGLPFLCRHAPRAPPRRRRDLGVGLVGGDLDERLLALHEIALAHEPSGDGPLRDT